MPPTMFKKTLIYFILALSLAGKSFGQSDSLIYFFTEFMQPVARDQAINVGIAVRDGKLWKLDVYDNLSEKLVITGHYADSLLKSAEGPFQYLKTAAKRFKKGKLVNVKKKEIW